MSMTHGTQLTSTQPLCIVSPQIKKHANSLLEVDTAVEEECRARAEIEEQCGAADRKGIVDIYGHLNFMFSKHANITYLLDKQ